MATNTNQVTITKLPKLPLINPKEELALLKSRNQEVNNNNDERKASFILKIKNKSLFLKLEREVASFKRRLEELRRAKHDLIVKTRTEYLNTGAKAPNEK